VAPLWFASLFVISLSLVDDKWFGRIYVLCDADDSGAHAGIEEGDHTVQMEAVLHGRDEVLRSNSVSFSLSCSAALP